MRHAGISEFTKKSDIAWTVVGVVIITVIAITISAVSAGDVSSWTQREWVLLICMLAIGLICTLMASSDFALIIQLYVIGVLFFIDINNLRTELLLVAIILISALSLHSMKRKIIGLLEDRRRHERELQKAYADLKKVDEVKDEMIFVASHDLRTPLSIIKLNLATIREGYAGRVNKEASSYIDAAYRAAERLGDTLEDLLEASAVEHKESLEVQPVQLETVIESIVGAHKDALKHLKVKLPAKPYKGKVLADPLILHRVIENLIVNASKYTLKGSIIIAVQEQGSMVRCTIADTGIGIPPEAQARLFTKFYRAPNALNIHTRGSGLGLYITKQAIQRLRGNISVKSDGKSGSTFIFELPKANA